MECMACALLSESMPGMSFMDWSGVGLAALGPDISCPDMSTPGVEFCRSGCWFWPQATEATKRTNGLRTARRAAGVALRIRLSPRMCSHSTNTGAGELLRAEVPDYDGNGALAGLRSTAEPFEVAGRSFAVCARLDNASSLLIIRRKKGPFIVRCSWVKQRIETPP